MTKQEKLNALNELLKAVFAQGWRVGVAWNSEKYKELFDLAGYLRDDIKIEKELRDKTEVLLKLLGLNIANLIIYTKEDHSAHSGDWDYIAPLVEFINK